MPEQKIGKVVKFFSKINVAAIEVTEGSLRVGETIHIKGHTTDHTAAVTSMQIDRAEVESVNAGTTVGIRFAERVREGDEVFKITD